MIVKGHCLVDLGLFRWPGSASYMVDLVGTDCQRTRRSRQRIHWPGSKASVKAIEPEVRREERQQAKGRHSSTKRESDGLR
jgi:hypothetical protein